MIEVKTAARISFGLGIVSLLAVVASHLALTDIRHGETEATLEWRVLQISFALMS